MTALCLVISRKPMSLVPRHVFKTARLMCLTGELYRNGVMEDILMT